VTNEVGFVEYAHGTIREHAEHIMRHGLSSQESLRHQVGSRAPGSFFTVRVDSAQPAAALETAAFWGSRHEGEVCVLICRLPIGLVRRMERQKLLVHTVGPTQSVFFPRAFDTINRTAQWYIYDERPETP
jgi:hypothetical protein